ncbi:Uncharacterised protein [Delftia tsuruhatensis]|nr:Uncharacterised protein [Delftia tsuruhatensis]
MAGRGDLSHDVGDAAHAGDDLVHGLAGGVHLGAAFLDLADRVVDQLLDFLGGRGRALGQRAHLGGDDGEAPPLVASASRFHRRVQRQDVGLEGDGVDDADDVHDLARGIVDGGHGLHDLGHGRAAAHGHLGGGGGQLVGLLGVGAVLLDGGGQLLHGRGGLLQRAGLLFGAGRQVLVARGDLAAGGGDRIRALADLADDALQAFVHVLQGLQQLARLVLAMCLDAAAEVTGGDGLRQFNGLLKRSGDAARDEQGQAQAQGDGAHQQGDDPPARGVEDDVARVVGGLGPLGVDLHQLVEPGVDAAADGDRFTTQDGRCLVGTHLVGQLDDLRGLLRVALQVLADAGQQFALARGVGMALEGLVVLEQLGPQLGHALVVGGHLLLRGGQHMLHGLRTVALQLVAQFLQRALGRQPVVGQIRGGLVDAVQLDHGEQAQAGGQQQQGDERGQQLGGQLQIAEKHHGGRCRAAKSESVWAAGAGEIRADGRPAALQLRTAMPLLSVDPRQGLGKKRESQGSYILFLLPLHPAQFSPLPTRPAAPPEAIA